MAASSAALAALALAASSAALAALALAAPSAALPAPALVAPSATVVAPGNLPGAAPGNADLPLPRISLSASATDPIALPPPLAARATTAAPASAVNAIVANPNPSLNPLNIGLVAAKISSNFTVVTIAAVVALFLRFSAVSSFVPFSWAILAALVSCDNFFSSISNLL